MTAAPVLETSLSELPLVRRGKVRDVYDLGDEHYLIVATDRISAFDCILPTPIARKGEVLTTLSCFWFEKLAHISPHHLITADVDQMPDLIRSHSDVLRGRSMFVRRTNVFPVECVVRGYLSGSGWKDYQRTGEVCGHKLPAGLRDSDQLPEPIFTPSTKADVGHDENISEATMRDILGSQVTEKLSQMSLGLYSAASRYALERGIIIADTKFEFGLDNSGQIILIDEALTPDSSRFWAADDYEPGRSQRSFDKQTVRDYLEGLGWDKLPPAPPLPADVAEATTVRYMEVYQLLTGKEL